MAHGGDKVFRDNVHGYIKVPKSFVKYFIDTEIFQRLRFIEQTGMRTLYPSARHDRFIHSLGTFYLGQKAFENFKNNVEEYYSHNKDEKRNHFNVFSDKTKNSSFWHMCGTLFLIACLLHDSGHAPFSHTLEFIYEQEMNSSSKATLVDKLKQYLNTTEFIEDFESQNPGSEHERMSALVVCTEFADKIEEIIEKDYPDFNNTQDALEFICRMIIGCTYQGYTRENQIKNCFIALLNSKSIDVDSLDYIIRDSKLSGIDNMAVDVDRLLSSLTIVERTVFNNTPINTEIHTNILNGILVCQSNRKANINALCKGEVTIEEFSGEMSGKLSLVGNLKFKEDYAISKNDMKIFKVNGVNYDRIVKSNDIAYVELDVISEKKLNIEARNINADSYFNGTINVKCASIRFPATYVEGLLTGLFTGELLGNYVSAGGTLKCELGFHKSSLSVIQNVVSARNYEYQWIYSHHKVVYYSNYLIVDLLKKSIKHLLKLTGSDESKYEDVMTNIISWETMIKENEEPKLFKFANNFYFRTNDSDIVSIFKQCYLFCLSIKDESDCFSLLTEYFSRNYRKSVWKSYAEYCIFFSDLSDSEKLRLFDLLKNVAVHGVADKYGYFPESWNSRFSEIGFDNVIWVNGNSKLKRLDPDNTFILFKNNPLNFRSVSLEKDLSISQQINLFYVYYDRNQNYSESSNIKLKKLLKEELSMFIQSGSK